MLPSLRELGLISARYAEEEAKQRVSLAASSAATGLPAPSTSIGIAVHPSSLEQPSTLVSAPMPPVAALQKTALKNSFSPVTSTVPSSSSSSSTSLPPSPVISNSPPTTDYALPAAMLPLLTQRASLPGADKLQQLGLGLLPLAAPFQSVVPPSQGVLVQTPFGLTSLRALSAATVLAAGRSSYIPPQPPQPQQAQNLSVFSSLQSSRMRKPFHKRRPAHMDKSMLFCHFCGRKETPEWRKGPAGPATLCNACGLQWAKKVRAQRNSSGSRSSTNSVQDVPESVAVTSETASSTTKDAAKQEENATTA